MGITNLTKTLKKLTPEAYNNVDLEEYAGKRIGIDISVFMYQFKCVCVPDMGSNQYKMNKFIDLFLNLVLCLLRKNIKPIFVFDGPSPPEKREEQEKRSGRRKHVKDKINEFSILIEGLETGTMKIDDVVTKYRELTVKCRDGKIPDNYKPANVLKIIKQKKHKMKNQTVSITNYDNTLVRTLFHLLGIQYYTAGGEADAMCSYMYHNGIVDSVISDDNDFLGYKVKKILSNLDFTNGRVLEVNYEKILQGLKMGEDQFLDMCIMFGNDYNSNVFRVGPAKTMKLINEYKSIEKIIESGSISQQDALVLKYERVREMYKIFPYITTNERDVVSSIKVKRVKISKIDWKGLGEFLSLHKSQHTEFSLQRMLNLNPSSRGILRSGSTTASTIVLSSDNDSSDSEIDDKLENSDGDEEGEVEVDEGDEVEGNEVEVEEGDEGDEVKEGDEGDEVEVDEGDEVEVDEGDEVDEVDEGDDVKEVDDNYVLASDEEYV